MSIGENIKILRKREMISQEKLAKKVNVARSMIAQIERGTKTLTIPLGIEIAKALNCSIKDLIEKK